MNFMIVDLLGTMLENGNKINNMGTVLNTIKMVIHILVSINLVKCTAKEYSVYFKEKLMKVIFNKTEDKDLEYYNCLMAQSIKDNSKITKNMGLVKLNGQIILLLMDIG